MRPDFRLQDLVAHSHAHQKNIYAWQTQTTINETHQFLITALFIIGVGLALVSFVAYTSLRDRVTELEQRINSLEKVNE